jgi:hypothetical protein
MRFFHRLRSQFRKQELDKELSEELAFHIEQETEENIAAGMSAKEARYAALRKFGGIDQVKEECRDAWGLRFIDTLLQDLRFGLRMLVKNPGFTTVVVLSLALGIGVNTAIFSLVDQLLLWSIPGREPSRIVMLEGGRSGSYPFYCAYRDRNQVFSGVFASSNNTATGIRPADAPTVEVGHVQYISGNYFRELGIGATIGRVLTPLDDANVGGSPVVILSYNYWQRRFAGDEKVLGQKLAVNSYPLVIVGIRKRVSVGCSMASHPMPSFR